MDQDDSMLSTPSSTNDDTFDMDDENENQFAASSNNNGTVPVQIPHNDHLNAAAPGELSPPRSQTRAQPNGHRSIGGVDADGSVDDDDDEGVDMASSGFLSGPGGRGGQAEETKPGAGWKDKKAQDEMQRAWDHVVDKDFSLKEYGDVMMQA